MNGMSSNSGTSKSKTKVSISILGDTFVDLSCYLHDLSSTNTIPHSPSNNTNSSNFDGSDYEGGGTIVPLGGDTRLNQPVQITAGGSGLNTATHLRFLISNFERLDENIMQEELVKQEEEQKEGEENDNTTESNNANDDEEANQEKLTKLFTRASTLLKNVPSSDLSDNNKLRLYGLFKQATVGKIDPSSTPRPSTWNISETYKYNAWHECREMTKEDAMFEYVGIVSEMDNEVGIECMGLLNAYHSTINVDVPDNADDEPNSVVDTTDADSGVSIEEEITDVTLQSAFNESDYYGQILIQHAVKHGFKLLNCDTNGKLANGEESAPTSNNQAAATGHCIVLVSNDPYAGVERSFLTHLGSLQSFKASHTVLHELTNIHSLNPDFSNHHHHVHISGYYNLPGFQNGSLRKRLNLIRNTRRQRSRDVNVLTTTTSLVPQYDATEEWDGQLLQLLPLLDFLILNLMEAVNIVKLKGINVDEYTSSDNAPLSHAMLFLQLAKMYKQHSPQTFIIITIGKKGAVALHNGHILCVVEPARILNCVDMVDPTGAGDAFCAGFLHAIMEWRCQKNYLDCAEIGSVLENVDDVVGDGSWVEAVKEGMKWGVVMGTACCLQKGASTVSTQEEIKQLLSQVKDYGVY